jgi:hypothetical protein
VCCTHPPSFVFFCPNLQVHNMFFYLLHVALAPPSSMFFVSKASSAQPFFLSVMCCIHTLSSP